MFKRHTTVAAICLGLGSLTLARPTPVEAQVAQRASPVQAAPAFTLMPQSACLHLSTMQISTNSQQGMRSDAQNHNSSRSNRSNAIRADVSSGATGTGVTIRPQNHNSSRSNRTQPMPRPDLITDDVDGDGFPDVLSSARIRIVESAAGGRVAAGPAGATGPVVQLEIWNPDSDDDGISDLVDATTFRVVERTSERTGNPLHEEAASEIESPLFEGSAATDDGPTRTWTYALVPAGGPDLDGDGWGDALSGASVHVHERGGRFHVDLELAASESRADVAGLFEAPAFSISKRSARTGR